VKPSTRNGGADSSYAQSLAARWREKAESLSEYGASSQATALLKCAAELESAEREFNLEELTLEQASIESGFSYSSLQKRLAGGTLANAGAKGTPRVRRADLPRKRKPDVQRSIASLVLASSGQ